jgi:hypothetical protein
VTATGNGGATVKRRWSVSRWMSQPTHMMKFSRDSTMHVATSRRMREASREAPRAAWLTRATQHSAERCSSVQHNTAQCTQHSTAQQSPAQGGTAQRKATQHSTAEPSTRRHSATQGNSTAHMAPTGRCDCDAQNGESTSPPHASALASAIRRTIRHSMSICETGRMPLCSPRVSSATVILRETK